MPAETHVERGPMDRRQLFELIRDRLADILEIDPSSISAKLNTPLEATWRIYNGKSYFFVFNMSPNALSAQSVTLNGIAPSAAANVEGEGRSVALQNASLTDNFAPYELHVYSVG